MISKTRIKEGPPRTINTARAWNFSPSLGFILFALASSAHAEFVKDADQLKGGDAVHIKDVQATGAVRIGDADVAGDKRILHFVTPKGAAADKVTLTAILTQDTPAIRDQVDWDGATEDPTNPLKATISKATADKYPVVIKINGQAEKEIRVWVVWAIMSGTVGGIELEPLTTANGLRIGTYVSATIDPIASIAPATIITDTDRPDLSGPNKAPALTGSNSCGLSLSDGVNSRWDISRRVTARTTTTPNGLTHSCNGNEVNFPADLVTGNDDGGIADEYDDPYSAPNIGKLVGHDRPTRRGPTQDSLKVGNVGDIYRNQLWFEEFARLQIGKADAGVWVVISDPLRWRMDFRMVKRQVTEALWNTDVNGDGDKLDNVTEAMIGQDTNGDGDMLDNVGYWDNDSSNSANDNANIPN